MADVFISYSSEDRERVRPLAEALMARGYSVWWDRQLAAGDDYASVIGQALSQAKAVVVVWTATSAASVWVRDEAARAREDGRLVPVLLDPIEIPLGFGAIQAEDFTQWNGRAEAAQVSLLEESVKARIEGRGVDGLAVASRRKRLMRRIRLVSILTVAAAVVGIGAGLSTIWRNHEQANAPVAAAEDPSSQLLRLLEQGAITPEQAIELARYLEDGAFEGASVDGPPADPGGSETMMAEAAGDATVTPEEFDAVARDSFREAVTVLANHPSAEVRTALVQLSNPATRTEAMSTMWRFIDSGDPAAQSMLLLCGSVGAATGHPRSLEALERARAATPQDSDLWRMTSFAYAQDDQVEAAQASALVGAGLEARQENATDEAAENLEQALPNLQDPELRGFVQAEIGAVAEQQGDWMRAAQAYQEAVQAQVEAGAAPDEEAGVVVSMPPDLRSRLARSLDRTGQARAACREMRAAAAAGDTLETADEELLRRCNVPRTPRTEVVAPGAESTVIQQRPSRQVTPAPTP
jgi:tetratricopeptide (TPR) repeat protein